jgi:putative phage-type endonuclease
MSNDKQRTDDWYKAREGKLTASMFAQAAGIGPGSRQQAWRRILGLEDVYENEAMSWGTENEPIAIEAYRARHLDEGQMVELVGFVPHPTLSWVGCSPDLLVGSKRLAEIKCPASKEIYPEIPPYYMAQMQGQLEVTDRDECDFVVWTPNKLSVRSVARSHDYWDWLHERLAEFWMYVAAGVEPPRSKRVTPPDTSALISPEQIYYLNEL